MAPPYGVRRKLATVSRREPLSVPRIVAAARARIDADGLESLSMRKLGADLGVEAMALYKHVPDKDALVRLVVASVYEEMDVADPSLPWDERLRHAAAELRRAALAHPHLMRLVVTEPPATPAVQRRVDGVLGALLDATGDESVAVRHFWVFVAYVSGALLAETAAMATPDGGAVALDTAACPVLASLGPRLAACDFAAEYAAGLDIVIAAVPHRPRRRRAR